MRVPEWDTGSAGDPDEQVVVTQSWDEVRRLMWNYVGIVRTTKRLERAQHRIQMLTGEVADYYGHFRVTPDLIGAVLAEIPDVWLNGEDRAVYADYLTARLANRGFVEEAEAARG